MAHMIKIALYSLLLLSLPAIAEDEQTYNQITFSTSTETQVAQDKMVITMSIIKNGHDLLELANSVNETMEWALETANREKNIETKTLSYNTSPNYEKGKQKGWRVSQSLSMTSSDIKGLSKLMGKLQSKLQTQSVSYMVTPERRRQKVDELSTLALKQFSQKATSVTKALGRNQYKIVRINLQENASHQPRPAMMMTRGVMAAESVSTPSFQTGSTEISVTASGTIEILD